MAEATQHSEELQRRIEALEHENELLRKQLSLPINLYDNTIRKILHVLNDYILTLNAERQIVSINYLSNSSDSREIIGSDWLRWVHDEDKETVAKAFSKALNDHTTQNIAYRVLHPQKGLLWFKGHLIKPNESNSDYLVLLASDISEIKTREAELIEAKARAEEEREQLNFVLEGSYLGFWDWDIEQNVVKRNQIWAEMLGYTLAEVEFTVTQWTDLIYPDDRQRAWESISNHLNGISPEHQVEYRMITKNQGTKWILDRAKIVKYSPEGKPLRMSGTHTDITKRIEAEEALKEAKARIEESNQLKTEFLNNLSHEIRTPLNGILGFAELLNTEALSNEKRALYVSIMQNSGNQLLRNIDDILEISRLHTKQIEVNFVLLCLNNLMLQLFSSFSPRAKAAGISLHLQKTLNDEASHIYTDGTKLHKILYNLIENAIKFTKEGYVEISYHLDNESLPEKILIQVKDTGIGIGAESHRTIFDRFTQEKKEFSGIVAGLGLGLAIAKETAQLIEGEILLQSEKGEGSTFTLEIPYKPVHVKTTQASNNPELANTTKPQHFVLLVVEDEETNYLFIEALLENHFQQNCTVLHARNGEEAIRLCQQHTSIDCVLMDIKMPQMDGIEATRRIRAFCPTLPIVIQTAYDTTSNRQQAHKAGCNDFITKPMNQQTLWAMINKHLINPEEG